MPSGQIRNRSQKPRTARYRRSAVANDHAIERLSELFAAERHEFDTQKPRVAAIYMRSAVADQDAIERQREFLNRVASQHGIAIVADYLDFASGVAGRPQLNELLAAVERHEFDTVLVADLSRLSRSLRQMTDIRDRLASAGVDLVIGETPYQ